MKFLYLWCVKYTKYTAEKKDHLLNNIEQTKKYTSKIIKKMKKLIDTSGNGFFFLKKKHAIFSIKFKQIVFFFRYQVRLISS